MNSTGLRRVLHQDAKTGLPDPQVLPLIPSALQGHVQGENQRTQGISTTEESLEIPSQVVVIISFSGRGVR